MKIQRLDLNRAAEWLLNKKSILPETVVRKAPKEYQGPFPRKIAEYYNSQLDDERRQYLYDRLITKDTIDKYLIGYKPDYQCYTLPFWSGYPGQSQIDALQYRVAPWNPNQKKKYWWAESYYKPCVFNKHLINHDTVIVCFGTLDALLAAQDGLPMISASGLNTFANKNKIESLWLADLLRNVRNVIVLPDSTVVEHEPATKVMQAIGAKLKFFPYTSVGKDYNEYRMSKTPQDFVKEILEMIDITWRNRRLYAIGEQHLDNVEQCIKLMCKGQFHESLAHLLFAAQEVGYHSSCFSHAIQMMADTGPREFDAPFSSDEWMLFIERAGDAWESYTDLKNLLQDWSDRANAKLGAF